MDYACWALAVSIGPPPHSWRRVQRADLDRFALVKPVDPDYPGVADITDDRKKTLGTVGIRIILTNAGATVHGGSPEALNLYDGA